MNEIILKSWEDVCCALFDNSWQDSIQRHCSPFVFRGISDNNFELRTSLSRLGESKLEYHLLRNFKKYAQISENDLTFSDWKWITIAQHHGLPTRLLDWTFSPFIALHFATCDLNKYDKDGAIWCIDFVKAHNSLPPTLQRQIGEMKSTVFTISMLNQVAKDLAEFDKLVDHEFVVFFEPPSIDTRIVNQYALFSVMNKSDAQIDSFIINKNKGCAEKLYIKYIIPKEIKWEIRNKLDQANITERMLFPGLDGLSNWLRRHYGKAPY